MDGEGVASTDSPWLYTLIFGQTDVSAAQYVPWVCFSHLLKTFVNIDCKASHKTYP